MPHSGLFLIGKRGGLCAELTRRQGEKEVLCAELTRRQGERRRLCAEVYLGRVEEETMRRGIPG